MSWYREGTINLVKGSVDVVGVGTAFKSEVRFSDILLVNGVLTEIIRVESDTKLKLATAWSGVNLTGASFAVIRNLTNASNYDLMKKIEEFLTDRQRSMDEFVDWINAAPVTTGAPDAGKFPLTDRYGVAVYCKSPQQLEYEADVRLNRQDELIDETEAILTESEARLAAIGNQQTWANQILGYKNDAAASATLAQKWADDNENVAVTTGKYSAKHHAIKAAASQADVTTRQADVQTRQNNVISLESSALSSKNAAAASATTASTKATEASNSATASANSATNALASEIKASKWAEEAENTLVETGKYSAKHHALKAAASATAASTSATNAATAKTAAETAKTAAETARTGAQTAEANAVSAKTAAEAARDRAELAASSLTGNLSEYGGINLSGGAYPAAPESAGFWKVTVGGTVGGINYGVGDTLVYSKNLNEFYKIDNTESVTSVNGKTGVVALTAADVGAVSTTGNAATATKLQTARTITLTGDVDGSASFDGSANVSINAQVADNSHTHTISNVGGLQAALDGKAPLASPALTGNPTAPTPAAGDRDTSIATTEFVQAAVDKTAWVKSHRDFNQGTLIKTSIPDQGPAWLLQITGNSYALGTVPFDLLVQGYGYGGSLAYGATGLSNGEPINGLVVFSLGGVICFWFPRQNYWQGFNVFASDVLLAGRSENAVTSIDDAPMPVGATMVAALSPLIKQSWHTGNIGAASISATQLTGTIPDARLSGTYTGVNITGNAATATKLQTARTINGVSFDGTANITVADSTKLPLTGGVMTGTLITKITGHSVGYGGGDGSLSVRGDASSAAVMTFHRGGAYAINLGLDTDNVFRLGGWSDGTNVYRFQVDGGGNFTASGNVTTYSDIRLKKDIRVIPDALAKVEQLSGVTYERIDSGERQTGLIAQEVQKVLPEAVSGDDMLSVAYGNLVGLLVEAIKELKAEVDELKLKVAA